MLNHHHGIITQYIMIFIWRYVIAQNDNIWLYIFRKIIIISSDTFQVCKCLEWQRESGADQRNRPRVALQNWLLWRTRVDAHQVRHMTDKNTDDMTGIRWLSKRDDIQANVEYIILRELWTELMVKWPRSYWDDWMREPAQRKGLDNLKFHQYWSSSIRLPFYSDTFEPLISQFQILSRPFLHSSRGVSDQNFWQSWSLQWALLWKAPQVHRPQHQVCPFHRPRPVLLGQGTLRWGLGGRGVQDTSRFPGRLKGWSCFRQVQ